MLVLFEAAGVRSSTLIITDIKSPLSTHEALRREVAASTGPLNTYIHNSLGLGYKARQATSDGRGMAKTTTRHGSQHYLVATLWLPCGYLSNGTNDLEAWP